MFEHECQLLMEDSELGYCTLIGYPLQADFVLV